MRYENEDTNQRSPFSQESYQCRLDWGWSGARQAAERGDIIVIVDTLSFSTSVACAVHNGGLIYPCPEWLDPAQVAREVRAEASVARTDVPNKGRFSLSPYTYMGIESRTKVVLWSPNGGTCCHYGAGADMLLIGCIVNAKSVAEAVTCRLHEKNDCACTIVACGERNKAMSEDGFLRMAIEDYLGAGAIISSMECEKSPEALVCESAFRGAKTRLKEILRDCGSGRELSEMGFGEDVEFAARLNSIEVVPVLRNGYFEAF